VIRIGRRNKRIPAAMAAIIRAADDNSDPKSAPKARPSKKVAR
jgi:hypothetical protein